jgi:plasmid stabilization system protein ParE
MNPVIIAPEAEGDLIEAYQWYEKQIEGLGSEFLLCVDACIQGIARNPKIHQKVHKNIRRALVRRFPYGIFFIEEAEHIRVVAVFHAHRDPAIWQSRK